MTDSTERGGIVEIGRASYPLTIEEIAGLVEHLPLKHEDREIRQAALTMSIVLDQIMRWVDGLAPPVHLPETLRSEHAALSLAIANWLEAVGFSELPARVVDLRDGLWLESVTRAGIRDVRLVFEDGHWDHRRSVPVAGDPFWFEERLWAIQYPTAERDENGEIVFWTVCRERPAPEPSIKLP